NPDGQGEAEQVVELLAAHPSTARFVATKLARRFIADDPPAELVERAAETFLQTDGDIKSVLRVVLFDGLDHIQPKYKRPLTYLVSALRPLNVRTATGASLTRPTFPLLDLLSRLGHSPFGWPTPDGYPDAAGRWIGNLMPRWQFALAFARNDIDGTTLDLPSLFNSSGASTPQQFTDQLSTLLLGAPLDSTTRDDLLASLHSEGADEESLPQILTAALIASPAFQWR
ncbi:MAG TPA: DUF1800 family protein, partial [Anaerolineales bacterium]|nr:DUF1800 family protein [Anaerolineales bacterium]